MSSRICSIIVKRAVENEGASTARVCVKRCEVSRSRPGVAELDNVDWECRGERERPGVATLRHELHHDRCAERGFIDKFPGNHQRNG